MLPYFDGDNQLRPAIVVSCTGGDGESDDSRVSESPAADVVDVENGSTWRPH